MKNLVLSIVLAFTGSVSFAQSDMSKQGRQVGEFDKISVCCGINVYITDGYSPELTVEVNDISLFDIVKTEVTDSTLFISIDNDKQRSTMNAKINVHLFADNLAQLKASSGADIFSVGELYAEDITLSATSGADIKLDLNTSKLACDVSSGSNIELKGRTTYAKLEASSAGDISMEKMIAKVVDASASSGSDIYVYVTDELNANASSGSDIKYKGQPKTLNEKQSSGGRIIER